MSIYIFGAGFLCGTLVHMYRWKLGYIALKSAVYTKSAFVNFFHKEEDIIIPTAASGVEEHIFNTKNDDSQENDYRKVYLIGNDAYTFKEEQDKILKRSDDFLCCFIQSNENGNGDELVDVSSQLKKSIFYLTTDPKLRSKFTIKTFLTVCRFENHQEVELVWIDKDLTEHKKTLTQKHMDDDIYFIFQGRTI